MNRFHSNLERVFQRDPDLLNGIPDVEADRLRRDVVVRCVRPEPGELGFDLYMYIGSARPCRRAVRVATECGLFVEPGWPSPQIADDS